LTLDSDEFVAPFHLPRPPFISMASFNTYDIDDAATTVTSTDYRIVGADPARIEMKNDGWTFGTTHKAAVLVYTAGYGAAAAVPEDIKTAVRIIFTDLYELRQNFVGENLRNINLAQSLLRPYRIGYLTAWT
jgi:hypothetical protein